MPNEHHAWHGPTFEVKFGILSGNKILGLVSSRSGSGGWERGAPAVTLIFFVYSVRRRTLVKHWPKTCQSNLRHKIQDS